MQAVVLACAAQVVYIVAFVLFKSAARAMRPLSGRHPVHVVGQAARSARWLAAWWVLMAGFALGGIALVTLPIASALPAYALSLVLLLVVGMRGFGERPTSREWLAVVITVAAMLIAALSVVAGAEHPLASAPARDGELTAPTRWRSGRSRWSSCRRCSSRRGCSPRGTAPSRDGTRGRSPASRTAWARACCSAPARRSGSAWCCSCTGATGWTSSGPCTRTCSCWPGRSGSGCCRSGSSAAA
ncbi:hypothetical protein GEV43_12685 [Actinomadura sp. J1-007]|uniref:hypothetical protein n=1 Tax=Actinomadura sp. J1-007 TaxID=2661913 RepID=UPI0013287F3B|nr:hypothetical protein [Actinomadura sp. J1-007]MWK34807.1 hypothetical protein [Actinomadura sp. J1-007]